MDATLQQLFNRAGIEFRGFDAKVLPKGKTLRDVIGMDGAGSLMAMDAAYPLITAASAGIPAMLSTIIEPGQIEVLLSPTKAAEAVGYERRMGDWRQKTIMFPMIEITGEATSYGDYNNSGSSGVNVTFPQRQSYLFQDVTQWGEHELEMMGLAKVDLAAAKNNASIEVLRRYENKTYLFGVSGLQNYGMLNDPALYPDLTPTTKTAGGTSWITPAGAINATALEVLADVSKLFYTLQQRNKGLIDRSSKLKLIMSPESEVALTITNEFNVNVADLLKKNYPNLEVVTVPEYATAAGQKVQMVVDNIKGQKTWECAFTDKYRAHPIVVEMSSFKQKKSAGTWGTVIYMPMGITSLIGV